MSRAVLILFANLKGNLGDYAILHSMLEEVKSRHGDVVVHVMSHGQHGIDDSRFEAFRRMALPFEYKGRTPFRRVPKSLSLFKRIGLGKHLARRLIERYAEEFSALSPAESAMEYEAIYFAGGEQWSGYSNGISQLAVLHAVARSGAPLGLFPFSVKRRLWDTFDERILRESFACFGDRLVTRDSRSAETMRSIHEHVELGADCVLALVDLGTAVPSFQDPDGVITIALTEGDGSRRAEVHEMVRGLLEGGNRVRFLTTCEREDDADMRAISQDLGVDYLRPQSWQEAVAGFKASAMVVTNRLHCMIFTLFADVPLVPLVNREKVRGITRDAQLPHSLDRASELTAEKATAYLAESEVILSAMRNYLAEVREKPLAP